MLYINLAYLSDSFCFLYGTLIFSSRINSLTLLHLQEQYSTARGNKNNLWVFFFHKISYKTGDSDRLTFKRQHIVIFLYCMSSILLFPYLINMPIVTSIFPRIALQPATIQDWLMAKKKKSERVICIYEFTKLLKASEND